MVAFRVRTQVLARGRWQRRCAMTWREDLRAFGAEADRLTVPHTIEDGGFIVPGSEASASFRPGRKETGDARQEGQGSQGGPPAGPRPGFRKTAGPREGAAIEAIRRRVSTSLEFEGLVERFPGLRALPSPSGSNLSYLKIPVGVFHSLPRDAELVVEIPHDGPREPVASLPTSWKVKRSLTGPTYVPDIRIWAIWTDGVMIDSFHQYPDRSACIHMARGPGAWVWGVHPLKRLIQWAVLWIAKVLHAEEFERWPGLHHCSCYVRAIRDDPDEWCGCGKVEGVDDSERYGNHCRPRDMRMSSVTRYLEHVCAQNAYLAEIDRRDRPRQPSFAWW